MSDSENVTGKSPRKVILKPVLPQKPTAPLQPIPVRKNIPHSSSGGDAASALPESEKTAPLAPKNAGSARDSKTVLKMSGFSSSQVYTSAEKRKPEKTARRISKSEFRRIVGTRMLIFFACSVLAAVGLLMNMAGNKLGIIMIIVAVVGLVFTHPIELMASYVKRICDTSFSKLVKRLLILLHAGAYGVILYACYDDKNVVLLCGSAVVIVLTLTIALFKDGDPEKNAWGEPPSH